ncbi:phage portal protein [Aminobacter aminovorans]|uniref:HK97 family phage portal protein n=1 Tax=Aminobacter aminovorans TaxID=83263 RepID=A0AAC8YN55_AMIAI|nr:phage portal protein [Aminobacter aminovorans]AMS41171.1 Phage portal protein, HK97 family [Aminobacter aminovorans]MBB3705846.1 HK97 family phage portal protein [Aminobacter aminovorans]
MLDGLRNSLARGLDVLAQRVSSEPRYPDAQRVGGGSRTLAGVSITPDSAVTIATVWACLRYLSQTVAVLPWHAMKDGAKGAEIQSKHSVDYLINKRPNPEWSSFQFRETLTHWALRWGNGYAEIERDQLGRPFALWPIHPDRVEICRDTETGVLFYEVSNGAGGTIEIAAMDMFHLRGFGEGPVGVNVITYAAQSLGWAKAAQLFGSSFFGNGANVAGVVINKKGLKEGGLRKQRAEFDQLYKGVRNANKTAFLDNDADWKKIGLNAEETQLIEVHQYLVEEICRWFGVPPHKVMHLLRATFSNIEHQAIEVVVDSVSPWVKRFEDEADYKLFGQNRQGLYTKMNMRALMRGDQKTRGEYYKLMREVGAYSPNRILELEDENTIGAIGDIHTMNSTYTTLERIGEDPINPRAVSGNNGGPPMEPDDEAQTNMADFNRILGREVEHA